MKARSNHPTGGNARLLTSFTLGRRSPGMPRPETLAAIVRMKSKLLDLLKRWWFWLGVVLLCAIPTGEWMGATGGHYDFGVPFPSLYVKHGNMGNGGGTLREGFLFFSDGSPPPASGVRTGWFIHPELIGVGLNVALSLLVVYGSTQLWQRIRHAKQNG